MYLKQKENGNGNGNGSGNNGVPSGCGKGSSYCEVLYDLCYNMKDTKKCNEFKKCCKGYKPEETPTPGTGNAAPEAGADETTTTDWFEENKKYLIIGGLALIAYLVMK
jgi:hypothetical protein